MPGNVLLSLPCHPVVTGTGPNRRNVAAFADDATLQLSTSRFRAGYTVQFLTTLLSSREVADNYRLLSEAMPAAAAKAMGLAPARNQSSTCESTYTWDPTENEVYKMMPFRLWCANSNLQLCRFQCWVPPPVPDRAGTPCLPSRTTLRSWQASRPMLTIAGCARSSCRSRRWLRRLPVGSVWALRLAGQRRSCRSSLRRCHQWATRSSTAGCSRHVRRLG